MQETDIAPGFADPVIDAQVAFRVCLDAMAHPARNFSLPERVAAPGRLHASAAAVVLTLADFEVSLWLDARLAAEQAVVGFLRFHTGARIVDDPGEADFAVIADASAMPRLDEFKQGTPEYPDRSSTLIVQVDALDSVSATGRLTFEGPGIRDTAHLAVAPLPADFAAQLAGNRARFPCGVDIIFAAPGAIAALPRTTRLISEG